MSTPHRLPDLAAAASRDPARHADAAVRWLQAGAVARAVALESSLTGDALARVRLARGDAQGALDADGATPDTRARALVALGRPGEALQADGASAGRALALLALARPAEAAAVVAAWLRAPDLDPADRAEALTLLGRCYVDQYDYPRAIVAYRAALARNREIGALPGVVACLGGLGLCDLGTGHGLAARGAMSLVQAVSLAAELGDDAAEAAWRTHLDHALTVLDRTEQRAAELVRFREVVARLGDYAWEARLARAQAACWAALRDDERRLRYLAEAETLEGAR